ncbi:MAG: site-specific DNA-methyltransferase [Gallionella sp.]
MNKLYFGDNLHILRQYVADESVDLIYLDPPFNSKRDYNLLFKTPKNSPAKTGEDDAQNDTASQAQIVAFEDTWHWGQQAEDEFREIETQTNTDVAELMRALRSFLGENDMMAYLTMMANRLLQLHRVLKPTGSLYLHCDPTASHYLKIVLDGVFGKENYRNEISWLRSQPKSHNTINFTNCRDIILRYAKTDQAKFFKVYGAYDQSYLDKFYRFTDENGRRYRLGDITNPNKNRPNLTYEFLGVTRVWRWTKERMKKAYEDGLIYQSKPETVPQEKRYLDEMEGQPITDSWDDIEHLHGSSDEMLGYPTQKPLALLERIILASSNVGDVVLDPFCGCGTAVDAAQKTGRQWLGIDITHLSISLIELRMKQRYPELVQSKEFEVIGVPKDFESARNLALRDKYQFQFWALSLVRAQPFKGGKKGADGGIDGLIFPEVNKGKSEKIIVSVKGGENVKREMIAVLKGDVDREKAVIGLFITLTPPTKPMIAEAAAAGYYESPHHGAFPKIQILTIAGLLSGTEQARYPDMSYGGATFKTAKQEKGDAKQGSLI